jgi:hypothetical protein
LVAAETGSVRTAALEPEVVVVVVLLLLLLVVALMVRKEKEGLVWVHGIWALQQEVSVP